jgi:serine/threonine-protein kinase
MTDSAPSAPADHARLKAWFHAVCDLPDAAAQRAALTEQGVDEASIVRVLELVGHSVQATRFAAPVAAAARWLDNELVAGDRLGAWSLNREMGRGGMGRVFEAQRSDGHYEQRAAIKLLLGFTGPDALERLKRERQILARLEHPNIARLLDGGTTPAGRPYLVMEFADGERIDRYAAAHALALDARLALFDQVCEALAYAHRQLVIHCDIKPANVLVGEDGRARLLDFGISRLQGQTEGAIPAMTPGYASPEQMAGQAPGVASDIYSLGRLLQELVAPVRSKRLLRELDAIAAKATAPQTADRYDSVAALQRDLQRLRAHQPVQALPQTATYVAAKLLRRRWPWVTAGAAALVMAAGFTVRVVQERNEAQFQRQQAEGLIEFMLGDLRKKLEPVGRLDVLDSVGQKAIDYYAAHDLATLGADELGRRARALHLIGEVREQRGQLSEAQSAFEVAARTTAELLARTPDDPQRLYDHAQSQYWVGYVAYRRGEFPLAEARFTDYRSLAERLVALEPDKLDWQAELAWGDMNLGVLWYGDAQPERALQPLAAALATFQRLAAQREDLSVEVTNVQGWLALAHESLGDLRRALALEQAKLQRLLGLTRGRDDLSLSRAVMEAWSRIGHLQLALGQTEDAVDALQSATAVGDRLLAADPANLFWLQDACWTRIALGTARLARGDASTAQADARAGRDCADRLAASDAGSHGRQIGIPGALVLLEHSLRKAPATDVERDLASVVARAAAQEARGASLAEYVAMVAAVELALGDHRAEARDLAAAGGHWSVAQRRLQRPSSTGDWTALTLLARAQLRLGALAQARELAQRIEASPYRHPSYRMLTAELAAATGGRPPWAPR